MSSLVAKIEYVIIISNWTQKIMAGQKMKLRYSAESPWFPEKYIGWIMYGNRHHNTSTIHTMYYISCYFITDITILEFMKNFSTQKEYGILITNSIIVKVLEMKMKVVALLDFLLNTHQLNTSCKDSLTLWRVQNH